MYVMSLFIVPCPEIIVPPQDTTAMLGQTINFSCLAWSFGLLTYDWKIPNGVNQSTVKPYIHKNIYGGTTSVRSLQISNIQPSDEGEYCCVATNECASGSVSECAWLTVISKLLY